MHPKFKQTVVRNYDRHADHDSRPTFHVTIVLNTCTQPSGTFKSTPEGRLQVYTLFSKAGGMPLDVVDTTPLEASVT